MHTNILHRIAKLPVIREVLGACLGGAIAMSAYYVFEFLRSLFVAHGMTFVLLAAIVVCAIGCAFFQWCLSPSTMSEID